jgi:hypothetical protein
MAFQLPVPESVSAMAVLDRCGYEDAFAVAVAGGRTPGEWARLIVESAPALLLRFIRFAQHYVLGLQLGPADPAHPLGWRIVREDAQAVVLAAEGPGGAARIVGTTSPGLVIVTTQARFDGGRARALWPLIAPLHRRIARYLLDRAAEAARRP